MGHALVPMAMEEANPTGGWKGQGRSPPVVVFPKDGFPTFHLDLRIPLATIEVHQHREVRAPTQLGFISAAVHVLPKALALHVAIHADPGRAAQGPAALSHDLGNEALDA
eukprot:Skav214186  [mRNA]  locus=scaffold3641:8469:8981:- [translate_table: standard]